MFSFGKIKNTLATINASRGSAMATLESQKKEFERQIAYHKQEILGKKEALQNVKKQIAETKDDNWTAKDFKKALDEILKNKFVDWFGITDDNLLIVQTKMLIAYDAVREKQTKNKSGRYVFAISLVNTHNVEVHPIDFECQGYRHPNLMGYGMCWGDALSPIIKMLKSGEFYGAIDSLVYFFSCYPQDGGSHQPKYWEIWLDQKKIDFQENPWLKKKYIYTSKKLVPTKKISSLPKTSGKYMGMTFRGY